MMYVHHVIRTQLYLDEKIHALLRKVARKQGRTVSDLVREALDSVYGTKRSDERLKSLRDIAGLWRDRDDLADTHAYVRRLRRDTHRIRKSRR